MLRTNYILMCALVWMPSVDIIGTRQTNERSDRTKTLKNYINKNNNENEEEERRKKKSRKRKNQQHTNTCMQFRFNSIWSSNNNNTAEHDNCKMFGANAEKNSSNSFHAIHTTDRTGKFGIRLDAHTIYAVLTRSRWNFRLKYYRIRFVGIVFCWLVCSHAAICFSVSTTAI